MISSPPPLQEGFAAITRRGFVVLRHGLTRVKFHLLVALQQGATLGDAIARAADVAFASRGNPHRLRRRAAAG